MNTASPANPDPARSPPVQRTPARSPAATPRWQLVPPQFPGLALCAGIALLSIELGRIDWLASHGFSPLTLAILLGIAGGNTFFGGAEAACASGLAFSKQTLLRAGIVLYGLRLTFGDIGRLGVAGLSIDLGMIASTLLLAWWVGRRLLGMDKASALLIGAGAAICGAAAVLAMASVVRARSTEVAVAVATVVLFGTLALLGYPLLHLAFGALFANTPGSYGIFIGSTVHEVAQAVAAGSMFDEATANMAVVAKLGRVAMLAPVLLAVSAWHCRSERRGQDAAAGIAAGPALVIPWFAVGFLAMAGINSLGVIPLAVHAVLQYAGTAFLGMAMAALGLTTRLTAIRSAGRRPILLAAVLASWLMGAGLLANLAVAMH